MATENQVSLPRVQFRLHTIILCAALIIIGLVLLWLSDSSSDMPAKPWLRELSSIFIVSSVWTGIYEFFLRSDFLRASDENKKEILSKLTLLQHEEQLGFVECLYNSGRYDYTKLLEESEQLIILLNDGRTWVSNNSENLRRRFTDDAKKTTFLLLHPDSPMVEVIARKVGSSKEATRDKIRESCAIIHSLAKGNSSNIEVLGHFYFNPHSVFLGDKDLVVTPYFASKGRRGVPLFRFRNVPGDCYYASIRDDLVALKADSKEIEQLPDAISA